MADLPSDFARSQGPTTALSVSLTTTVFAPSHHVMLTRSLTSYCCLRFPKSPSRVPTKAAFKRVLLCPCCFVQYQPWPYSSFNSQMSKPRSVPRGARARAIVAPWPRRPEAPRREARRFCGLRRAQMSDLPSGFARSQAQSPVLARHGQLLCVPDADMLDSFCTSVVETLPK